MPVPSNRCPCTGSSNHSINLGQNPSDIAPGVGKGEEAVTATSGLSRRTNWVPISKRIRSRYFFVSQIVNNGVDIYESIRLTSLSKCQPAQNIGHFGDTLK